MAGVRAIEDAFISVAGHGVANYSVDDTVAFFVVYGHVREVDLAVLKNPLADRALIVFVLEACLLVVCHMRLRGTEVLAAASADVAREVLGVEVGVAVVLTHVDLVVTLELEGLKQQHYV